MKLRLLLIAVISIFTLTSCEKCKDCTMAYETINGFDSAELDAIANDYGYADFGAFYTEEMDGWESGEFCDEDLKDAEDEEELEDVDEDGTMDFRVYWDCK